MHSDIIMNISAMLSVLKVTEEVMKLLNDTEVHTYVYHHYTYVLYALLVYYIMIMPVFLSILYPCL